MTTKLYRCQAEDHPDEHGRLIFDFEAEGPICPKCGADAKLPEYVHTVVELVQVHFLVKDKAGLMIGKGSRYRAACDPKAIIGDKFRATGDPTAVTCRRCQESSDYPEERRRRVDHAEGDREIEINTQAQVITTKPGGCGCGGS